MKKSTIRKSITFTIYIISLLYVTTGYTQSYGLGFNSHEVIQDKRTLLDLFPQEPVCFDDDFEISFDVSFLPGHKDYFGYILRLIKDDTVNIDLIYDHSDPHFSIVVGEELPKISFNIDSNHLFKKWNTLRLKFDFKNDRILFFTEQSSFIQNKIGLRKGNCFKIYFGASQYKQFTITDVPPMKVRDVKLFSKDKLQFYWPLNERNGLSPRELISRVNGSVINPIWIRNFHYDWKLNTSIYVKGNASVAFNTEKELLYIAGADSLYSYSPGDVSITHIANNSGRESLLIGNQAIYLFFNSKLYSIYIDQKLVTGFDFVDQKWNKLYQPGPVTDFWHFNKFFSSSDTSMYIIGGYGHYKYRNGIFQYHLPTDSFQSVEATGERLIPRYLAALGSNSRGDSAYILGGYGSLTGQQIVNPQNLYDLVLFTSKDKKFKKLFDLKKNREEFVFANSLVMDEKSRTYYGLIFPNYKYNTELQLIKGSLTNPSFTSVGSKIPYSFHDINSFADLFYSPKSKTFVAVTLLMDSSDHTQIKIYSLQGPPEADEDIIAGTTESRFAFSRGFYWLLLLPPIIIMAWFIRRRRLRRSLEAHTKKMGSWEERVAPRTDLPMINPPADMSEVEKFQEAHTSGESVVPDTKSAMPELAIAETSLNNRSSESNNHVSSSIFLFGDMQVIDKSGADITKYFTPLIKELFLIILLYTLKKGRGITSEKLNELLWFDKSAQSARNNRSVNIAKLKNILEKIGDCSLSKDTGYWKVGFNYDEIMVDFREYLEIVRDREHLDKQKILQLANITRPGNFLANIEHEWLDAFKSEISNEMVDTYLHFAASLKIEDDPELLLNIAHYIYNVDPVNEEAMIIKCKALAHLGKHSLAKNAFDSFAKEYRQIYGQDFSLSFHAVIENS